MNLFQSLFNYVVLTVSQKNIDESHGIHHATDVLINAHNIYEKEVETHTYLKSQEKVIYISAVLHDMCDKKYMDEQTGISELNKVLYNSTPFECKNKDYGQEISGTTLPYEVPKQNSPKFGLKEEEIVMIKKIIATMSYSKVKENGFPQDLGDYTRAYHIVREADLLAAYDFDRAMVYHMVQNKESIENAFANSYELFQHRMFCHDTDGLLITDFAKQQHPLLMQQAKLRIQCWKKILHV